jgi:hypothetical protein
VRASSGEAAENSPWRWAHRESWDPGKKASLTRQEAYCAVLSGPGIRQGLRSLASHHSETPESPGLGCWEEAVL